MSKCRSHRALAVWHLRYVHLCRLTGWPLLILAIVHRIGGRLLIIHLGSTLFFVLLTSFLHGLAKNVGWNDAPEWWVSGSEEIAHGWERWHMTSHWMLFSLCETSRSDEFPLPRLIVLYHAPGADEFHETTIILLELLQIFSSWGQIWRLWNLHSASRHLAILRYRLHLLLEICPSKRTCAPIARLTCTKRVTCAHLMCLKQGCPCVAEKSWTSHDRQWTSGICTPPGCTQVDHLLTWTCHENPFLFLPGFSQLRLTFLKLSLVPGNRLLFIVASLLQSGKFTFIWVTQPAALKC